MEENRGKPITCKLCGHQFKFMNDTDRSEWKNNNLKCPSCNELYCVLPPTERTLRILQDRYYTENKPEKIMTEMIIIMKEYCKSLILKRYSNKIYEIGQLDYYAHNAVSFLVEEYCKDPELRLTISFAGALIRKIKQTIFGKQEHIIGDETLDYIYEDGHKKTYRDDSKQLIDSIEDEEDKFQLCKHLSNLMFDAEEYCDSKADNFIRLLSIEFHLSNGEKAVDKFFEVYKDKKVTCHFIYKKSLRTLKSKLQASENIGL